MLIPQRRALLLDGREVEVGARALDLLIHLVRHAGETAPKQALVAAAWGARVVEPNNLTVQITALRRILAQASPDGDPRGGAVIRTVPGAGYLFAGPVEEREETEPAATAAGGPAAVFGEPLTLFVGRQPELDELARLLRIHRLVSVTGIGGVGKTRLVQRLTPALTAAYPDGVVFVDLAPHADGGQVADIIATALGAGESTMGASATLIALLRSRQVLLLIDNAEHVLAAVRSLLQRVLAQCPKVAALVTSRESLGIPGERVFRLQPLAVPPRGHAVSADEALRYDAVRLFADRAAALLPGFVLDDDAAPDVARICQRLDGIALAIEMAVPRLQVLTPRQLAGRLADRFGPLAPARHDVLPRQRTLRMMFDWSWELLQPAERDMLQRLALFPGGATLAWLAAVQADAPNEWETLERLTSLVQKSLVVVQRGEPPRFRLLETTRQYALDHLPARQLLPLRRRHATHMATAFEQAEAEWPTTNSRIWLDRYGEEADNLRSALDWACGPDGDTSLALRLVAGSASLWWELPGLPLRERRRWLELALSRIGPDTPASIQGRLWLHHSWKDLSFNDFENHAAAARAEALFRGGGEEVDLVAALWRLATTVLHRDHQPDAAALLDEAVALLKRRAPTKYLALCLVRQADLLAQGGQLREALALYEQAMTIVRDLHYGYGLMICGGNRSYRLSEAGRREEALAGLRELRGALPPGLREPILSQLAMHLALAGDPEEARAAAGESLARVVVTGILSPHVRALEALAMLSARAGDPATAARFLGCALRLHPADRPRFGARHDIFVRLDATLERMLPPARRAALEAEGAAWTEEDVAAAAAAASARPRRGGQPQRAASAAG